MLRYIVKRMIFAIPTLFAVSVVAFIIIHVGQVVLTGFVNNTRSMITGWFVIKPDGFGQGRGGYWEDQGYEWYAGI